MTQRPWRKGANSLEEALAQPGVTAFHQSGTAGRPTRIPVEGLTGRYVRVQLTGNAPLSLAEVPSVRPARFVTHRAGGKQMHGGRS